MIRAINLETVPEDSTVETVRQDYVARVGEESGKGLYYWQDWARFRHVLPVLPVGASALDVGVFTGQFVDCLHLSKKYERITGIDIVRKPGFHTVTPEPDVREMSVARMDFADDSFDTVVCMEVIEHVEEDDYRCALTELRRVCRGYLLMSVPFDEREPISANHRRCFTPKDFLREFPDADYTLLYDPRQKLFIWAMIEERPKQTRSLMERAKRRISRSLLRRTLEQAAQDPAGLARSMGIA